MMPCSIGHPPVWGLGNLRERVRLLGETLKIETAPGKGTRLAVDIPRAA